MAERTEEFGFEAKGASESNENKAEYGNASSGRFPFAKNFRAFHLDTNPIRSQAQDVSPVN